MHMRKLCKSLHSTGRELQLSLFYIVKSNLFDVAYSSRKSRSSCRIDCTCLKLVRQFRVYRTIS